MKTLAIVAVIVLATVAFMFYKQWNEINTTTYVAVVTATVFAMLCASRWAIVSLQLIWFKAWLNKCWIKFKSRDFDDSTKLMTRQVGHLGVFLLGAAILRFMFDSDVENNTATFQVGATGAICLAIEYWFNGTTNTNNQIHPGWLQAPPPAPPEHDKDKTT